MTTNCIRYRKGYRYVLAEDYYFNTTIHPLCQVTTDLVRLYPDGRCTVQRGYAWNGASGPVVDTQEVLRASLEHDILYQLMRLGLISRDCQGAADAQYRRTHAADGGWRWWGRTMETVLGWWGDDATKPSAEPVVYTAP